MAVKTYNETDKIKLSKNFDLYEFRCGIGRPCSCTTILVDDLLANYLQQIRDFFGRPVTITSAYRCPSYNRSVGGATGSYHSRGMAADIVVTGVPPCIVAAYCESIGILGIGLYETAADSYFVHIDTRTYKSFWYGKAQAPRTTFGGAAKCAGYGKKPASSAPSVQAPSGEYAKADYDDSPDWLWKYFMEQIGNAYGVAGLLGNLNAESNLIAANLQISYRQSFKLTSIAYTESVDNGTYTRFATDQAGYGLAQWTDKARKAALISYAKSKSASIGNRKMQAEFLMQELNGNFKAVLNILKNATNVRDASTAVLKRFECPADQGVSVQDTRASFAQGYYDKFAGSSVSSATACENGYLATVTASALNVRRGPGANYGSMQQLKKGTVCTIIEEKGNWGKLTSGGWVSLEYVAKKDQANTTSKIIPYSGTVTASLLNVRTGPGTDNPILTQIFRGAVVKIVEEKDGWGRRDDGGWISLQYVVK